MNVRPVVGHVCGDPSAAANPALQPVDVRRTLSPYVFGGRDRTTRLRATRWAGEFIRATLTPDGPGTLVLRWNIATAESPKTVDARSRRLPTQIPEAEILTTKVDVFGPGGDWLGAGADRLLGADDHGAAWLQSGPHPLVARAAREFSGVRIGASGCLYHELLPVVLGQRITAGEAVRQWAALCDELGDPAPGPIAGLRLPPEPSRLAATPTWWFHPHGVEVHRARPLIEIARHSDKLWAWSELSATEAWDRLSALSGVGAWTIGSALGPALGDPDAFAVGDFHLKNLVSYNLAGEPRGTDSRLVELLEPYRGQRGRVVRWIGLAGVAPPKYGPRQRVLPMHRW